ncbi:hypothetical protein CF326_g6516 [Tilletia indica]|nr:hypothetical protein CF326_g6516 [Tilletia indica]
MAEVSKPLSPQQQVTTPYTALGTPASRSNTASSMSHSQHSTRQIFTSRQPPTSPDISSTLIAAFISAHLRLAPSPRASLQHHQYHAHGSIQLDTSSSSNSLQPHQAHAHGSIQLDTSSSSNSLQHHQAHA